LAPCAVYLGKTNEVKTVSTSPTKTARQPVSIYDGQHHIGTVIASVAGFEATTVDGLELGRFRSQRDAATAIWRHAHGQRQKDQP
jgi:hypothetical protein